MGGIRKLECDGEVSSGEKSGFGAIKNNWNRESHVELIEKTWKRTLQLGGGQ